jgi:2-polyprenyl-3-methyl-5-hydroxy-6-metoxy-1,4-benzoquinol methylase
MANPVLESRRKSSLLSGGTSGFEIKKMVIEYLLQNNAKGSLLDFGAGKGELIRILWDKKLFEHVECVDLYDRPFDLAEQIRWHVQDLNDDVESCTLFDWLVCSEVIEHLENPRQVFRSFFRLLKPGGTLVLTMPNQESIRAIAALMLGGHFALFLGSSYPAHITALLRLDLLRIANEAGFVVNEKFYYANNGRVPKLPSISWSSFSFGLLKGRLFSDNLMMVARKPLSDSKM